MFLEALCDGLQEVRCWRVLLTDTLACHVTSSMHVAGHL